MTEDLSIKDSSGPAGLLEKMARENDERSETSVKLTEAERHRLLVEWNRTNVEYPKDLCVHELFEAQAARTPDAVAIVFGRHRLTYRQLNSRANQLAHYLRGAGVGPEVLVGLCAERSPEMIIAVLGILKAGGAYVPLDPAYPRERLRFILDDARAPVLLTQHKLLAQLGTDIPNCRVVCLDLESEAIARSSAEPIESDAIDHNLAYVIYTSGSTGQPKGVAIEHHSPVALVHWAQDVFSRDECAGFLFATSICFDLSVFEMFLPLSLGGKIILADNALQLATLPAADEVTLLNSVPSVMRELLRLQIVPASVRTVCLAGEPLPVDLVQKIYQLPGVEKVYDLYGPSETTTYSTWVLRNPDGPHTIGTPIANTRVYLLDQNQQLVPIGVAGEIFIGGEGVARGYLNRPELTRERFVPDPFSSAPGARLYRTGDLGRYRPDGNLETLGRMDHQVKIRGYRIELGEVESLLRNCPGVGDAIVVAREDARGEKHLVAYVVAREGQSPGKAKLREHLKNKLPAYMVPADVVFLDNFPRTPNGKIDRKGLPAPEEMAELTDDSHVAPRTPLEEILAGIWCDVLGKKRIGIHDNFFDLGGHSLRATQVISRVGQALQTSLDLRALFDAPTIAGLANAIEKSRGAKTTLVPPILPVARGPGMALSFAQERLWFLDQLEPNRAVYNIPLALQLDGALNAQALKRSLDEVLRRHEALRTRFETVEGRPVQVIEPFLPLELATIDLRQIPESAREAEVARLCREEARRPFELARDNMFRVRLYQLAPGRHVLFLNMHHIASDGWSGEVLVRELGALYEAFAQGRPSPLPELAVQYADYAAWQRSWLQGPILDRQIGYWKKQLEGAPALLELPADHARPAAQTYRGAQQTFLLPKALVESLHTLGRREGATFFMTLLAAFNVLLCRYTAQEDLVVGTVSAGRNQMELEGMIGFFVNTLILRANLSGNPSFLELLARVREVTLGAYDHSDLPFERLVEELRPARSLSCHPLCQVVFAMENLSSGPAKLSGLTVGTEWVDSGTSKFDLLINVLEQSDGLKAVVEYSTDLFDAETIRRMLDNYQTLLNGIAANPEMRIAELPLLTAAERQQLLVAWNRTQMDFPEAACVNELFEDRAAETPGAVAVRFEGAELTYGELNQKANQLAHYLKKRGVRPEVLVGLYVSRSSDMIIGMLGILKAGGAYVPIDPAYPSERVRFILQDARAPLLLVQRGLLADFGSELPDCQIVYLDADQEIVTANSTRNLERAGNSSNLAYTIYTSGSTGRPKGVEITHRSLVNLAFWHQRAFKVSSADRASQVARFGFDAAVWEIWPYLTAGAAVCIASEETAGDPEALRDWLVAEGITAGFIPTPMAERLLALQWPANTKLRVMLTGADTLHIHPPAGLPFELVNNYGPTECTVVATSGLVLPDSSADRLPSIGFPVTNTQVYILDRFLNPVPIGCPGELHIGGAGVSRGYHNRPDLTAEKFISHPFSDQPGARLYKTGDRARYLPDGQIEFLGRNDNQVKMRGHRIELGEIESVLRQIPGVAECVVLMREDVPGNRRLVAYWMPKPHQPIAAGDLRGLLKEKLPEYMLPSAFVAITAFPLTPNGKLDAKSLPLPGLGDDDSASPGAGPRTPVETVLASLWEQVLNLDHVCIHKNFFELGGHSLLATQVMSRIRQVFEVELPLRAFFESPTVAGMAAVLLKIPARREELEKRAEIMLEVSRFSESEVEALLTGAPAPAEGGNA